MIVFWIGLAAIVAIAVAAYQYGYFNRKKKEKRKPWFALLRAVTVFAILFLFISPSFTTTTYTRVLPQLLVVADNSRSIEHLGLSDAIAGGVTELLGNEKINSNFRVSAYTLGENLGDLDTLTFQERVTDIDQSITELQDSYKDSELAMVVLTDGNQTSGRSYSYTTLSENTKLYPVVYGDTTRYEDLAITQINVNRFSYLRNEFPVEIFISYNGSGTIETDFTIKEGNKRLFTKKVSLSQSQRAAQLNITLESDRVGLKQMRAELTPLSAERNTDNNLRSFAVEVIDQQTRVLILADGPHPDIGALKKAIESNEQRQVDVNFHRSEVDYSQYNLVVFYGIGNAFAKAYPQMNTARLNTWVIAGRAPQLNLLNEQQDLISIATTGQYDEVLPILNKQYSSFDLEPFDYGDYPPARAPYGDLVTNVGIDVLMYKRIGNVETRQPLWFTYEEAGRRRAVTLASGLWRWRAQSYLESQSFSDFDDLVNSQVQLLASNKRRQRLTLVAEPFYYQNLPLKIQAQFLNKNYEFERSAILNLELTGSENNDKVVRPFVLDGNSYELDLDGLQPDSYNYTLRVQGDNLTTSGTFTVLPFDIEKQATGASDKDFKELIGTDNVYYGDELDRLTSDLLNSKELKPVQRPHITSTELIDWKYLLGIICLLLGLEWFLRKYNGLI